ncbi:MAG: hypothetical protein Q9161_007116 [Pseudevernia consocians]
MPLSPTTTSPLPTSNPKSSPGSSSGTAVPSEWVAMSYTPVQVSIKRIRPSIERFLGNSHDQSLRVRSPTTGNGLSTQGSGTKSGLPPALKSTTTSFSRSTTEYILAMLNKIKDWFLTKVTTTPFRVDAWTRLIQQTAEVIPSTESTAAAVPPDVIKTVSMPLFPIRVFYGKPPPFSLEAQKRKMRWRYRWCFDLAPKFIQEPDTQQIHETVQQYIDFIAPETETISVELLAQGAFNQAYNVTAENKATGFRKEYVFRVALPIYPYYKVESDVATTEFVRHTTTVPVPIIYAFDSSPNNKLGFEWMLMEKVEGISLYDVWDTMGYSTKQELTRTVANWMDQLSRLKFNKMGSLYCRLTARQMEFYMGPTLHSRLYEGDRLLHDIPRGPFESLHAFCDAVLDSTERHINDPRHSARHVLEATMSDEEPSGSEDESSNSCLQDGQKSEEEILAQADEEDRRNERDYGVTDVDLSWLPEELRTYRGLLTKLCSSLPTSETMITRLTHPDLSTPNIFVNESGVPVALIDWERARIEPTALFNALPQFLTDESADDPDHFYVPSGSKDSSENKGAKVYFYKEDDLAQIRGQNERTYTQVMGRIQKTHLRAIYREELKRLQSPICEALNRDPESLEQQLISRVYWPDQAPPNSATDWAVEHLGESILADSDGGHADQDREKLE